VKHYFTISRLRSIDFFIFTLTIAILSGCGGSSGDSPLNTLEENPSVNIDNGESKEKQALKAIEAYIQNGGDVPSAEIYTSAGITGVDSSNIDAINQAVKEKFKDEEMDKQTLQELVNIVPSTQIEDTTAPVITLLGNQTVTLTIGDTYTDAGASANDNVDGDITDNIKIISNIDTTKAGTYTIIYSVSDKAGNKADKERTVVMERSSDKAKSFACTKEHPWDCGKLVVDKHMLKHEDGTGFFWMGDTAWSMSYKLNREEVKTYLDNRTKYGFNVIQMIAISGKWHKENRDGERPFNAWQGDPKNAEIKYNEPNEKYWEYIDFIIDEAEKRGIYIALLPTWNDVLHTTDDAKIYGNWIAKRYKDRKNIIWVNGGDTAPGYPGFVSMDIWEALGRAIDNVDEDHHLITYHSTGSESPSKWLQDKSWLDFNMIQSGHCNDIKDSNALIKKEYSATDIPLVDAEIRYEKIRECPWNNSSEHKFTSSDVREAAYSQIFYGSFGVTYGHLSVYQMYRGGNDSFANDKPTQTWREALDDLGAKHMKYLVNLMKSRDILSRVPDNSIITGGDATAATRGDGYAFVYLPNGGGVTVDTSKISSGKVKAWWYSPGTGAVESRSGTNEFHTPTGSNDWILVLDDASKKYGVPGQID
jgi:effector-binding domain-containing protein